MPENTALITDKDGVIKDLIYLQDAGDDVMHLSGMLCPGFVNAHCHLELSHLQGAIPKQNGLTDFILHVIKDRAAAEEQMVEAMEKADREMMESGIVAVGDICNTADSLAVKKKSRLYYHNFIETMGLPEQSASARFDAAVELYQRFRKFSTNVSIVPHAPYSVSNLLFKKIFAFSENQILSLHSQESEEENEFIKYKKGPLLELYNNLGIDISFFQPTGKRSINYFLPHLPTDKQLILVHNVITNQSDIDALNQYYGDKADSVFYCLCPNANNYISALLPNVELLTTNRLNLVLGTDSLASNHKLNIFSEIQLLQKNFPKIPLTEMLRWATINGAKALKIDSRFGSFEVGKQPGVLAIEENAVKVLV